LHPAVIAKICLAPGTGLSKTCGATQGGQTWHGQTLGGQTLGGQLSLYAKFVWATDSTANMQPAYRIERLFNLTVSISV
jgi:hypothetical protein